MFFEPGFMIGAVIGSAITLTISITALFIYLYSRTVFKAERQRKAEARKYFSDRMDRVSVDNPLGITLPVSDWNATELSDPQVGSEVRRG